jgi:hypothetical protein
MASQKPKKSKAQKRERRERRFEAQSSHNPLLVKILGALGAVAMGAGTYGQFGPAMQEPPGEPVKFAAWILAGGAVILGAAIWLGTSGDPALRVGDPGVSTEKGGLRRLPWYGVEKVEWLGDAVRVTGKDEAGADMTIVASLASQPDAAAWIVKEARARVPETVQIGDDVNVPEASSRAGEVVAAEPPQVVGRRCAVSDKVIAYEPDARLCPRCERVFHKDHVPDTCPCGASLSSIQPKAKAAASAS